MLFSVAFNGARKGFRRGLIEPITYSPTDTMNMRRGVCIMRMFYVTFTIVAMATVILTAIGHPLFLTVAAAALLFYNTGSVSLLSGE